MCIRDRAKAEAEAKKAEAARLAALAAAAAAVPIVTKKVIVEKKEVIKEKEKEDDYLPCKEYEGHTVTDKENIIALFKHKNGQLYFAVYNKDDGVRLRSEGFKDTKSRDEDLAGVIKNINNREMYSTIRRGQYYINILEDKTGREVGRSCLLKDKVAPVPPVAAVAAAVAAPVVIKKVVEKKPEPPKPKEKEDDYLPCEAYANHKVTDEKNNIAQFTHKNGQHYFAMYHKNGKVRLRSEGFTDKNKLKSELDAVIKYHNEKGRYETISRGKYYINILKDPSGREVGRSCLLKEKISPIVAVPVVAAAAAIVKETPPPPKPKPVVKAEKPKPKPKPVVKEKPVVAAAAPAAKAGGCLRLWPLLLLGLLLLLLLLWWKGCFGCAAAPPAAVVPPVVTPVAPTPAPPVKVAICPAAKDLNLKDGIGAQVSSYLADPESTLPKRFNVGGIKYDKNSTRLNSRAKKSLDDLATCLKGCNNLGADIYGYISGNEQGSYRGNKEITLDDVRARGVVDYLKSRGIDTSRLNFEGGGTNDNGGVTIEIHK